MKKKKKNYNAQYPSDIQIDERGRGSFNALTVLWQLRTVIKEIFAPSPEEISKLADSENINWYEAREELLKGREEDINKCYQHAEELLRAEIGPLMDDLLWKLVGDIIKRTFSNLSSEIGNHQGSIQRRTKEAIQKHQTQNRRLLGLPDPGAPSQWNKSTLTEAVEQVANCIPTSQLPTLPKIAAKINEIYKPNKALTADGLRKLLDRKGIEWKKLRDKLKKRT